MKQERTNREKDEVDLIDLIGPSPMLWRDGQDVGHEDLLIAASALVRKLGDVRWLANYCLDRQKFMVAWLAGLMSGIPILLPPDRTALTFSALLKEYPGLFAITDGAMNLPGASTILVDETMGTPSEFAGNRKLRGDDLIAVMFTSGSTGYPTPIRKTLAMLRTQVKAYFELFGIDETDQGSLVATVPNQHMYGLESTVLTSLFSGVACNPTMPQFAARVIGALESMPPPRILITTPVHLQGLIRNMGSSPSIHRIISATAQLDPKIAEAAENRFATLLFEVFGATEIGLIATRRPSREGIWRTSEHVSIEVRDDDALVHADHIGDAVLLGDELEVIDSRRFLFKGRKKDNVNVAGKRISLNGLNSILGRIEGVEDGIFFQPAGDGVGRSQRVVVFAVAPRWSEQSLKREIRKHVDPAFVPKRIFLLERLPRNSVGKLSSAALSNLIKARV